MANVFGEYDTQCRWLKISMRPVSSGSEGVDEPFDETIRARAQRWDLDYLDAHIGDDTPKVGWIAHGASGVSVQQPELALLFKAATPRPQDDQDLSHAAELLTDHQRRWLHHAIRLAHPDSKWNRLL